jgi:hypothetical protein
MDSLILNNGAIDMALESGSGDMNSQKEGISTVTASSQISETTSNVTFTDGLNDGLVTPQPQKSSRSRTKFTPKKPTITSLSRQQRNSKRSLINSKPEEVIILSSDSESEIKMSKRDLMAYINYAGLLNDLEIWKNTDAVLERVPHNSPKQKKPKRTNFPDKTHRKKSIMDKQEDQVILTMEDFDSDPNDITCNDDALNNAVERNNKEEWLSLYPQMESSRDKKPGQGAQMLEYMMDNNIMSVSQMHDPQHVAALTRFVVFPHYNAWMAKFIEVVRGKAVATPFISKNGSLSLFTPLSVQELEVATKLHGNKIENLCRDIHGFNEATFKSFIRAMVGVADRKFGKQNCIYLFGKSNTGKSILLDSFMEFATPCVGYPSNNVQSGFPFGDCGNSRFLRFDECHIDMDNIELYKQIMGGNITPADKKYSSSIFIPATPCYISSNKPLWHLCLKEKDAITNRLAFNKYLSVVLPEDFGLLTKIDWQIVLSKYYLLYKLYDVRRSIVGINSETILE